jgi:hypothetical protein
MKTMLNELLARPIRDFEWEIWKPLLFPEAFILEFGNKKNSIGVYKAWLEQQGYRHVSIDINGRDGALPFDYREPIQPLLAALGFPIQYDLVTNSGTIEHVETNQEAAWRNAFQLTKLGGHQVHITPAAGHWQAHGLYHPKREFFEKMAELNYMVIRKLEIFKWTPGKVLTRCVLHKLCEQEFIYPGDHLMEPTPDALELERRRAAK